MFLCICRFSIVFLCLALGAVGSASRAGRIAIGLERKVSPPTPLRKIGRLLKCVAALNLKKYFDCSARSPADLDIGRLNFAETSTKAVSLSKDRESDIMFLIAVVVLQLGGGGFKIGKTLSLEHAPLVPAVRRAGTQHSVLCSGGAAGRNTAQRAVFRRGVGLVAAHRAVFRPLPFPNNIRHELFLDLRSFQRLQSVILTYRFFVFVHMKLNRTKQRFLFESLDSRCK